MRTTRFAGALLAALALTPALAACGGGSSGEATTSPTEPPTTTVAEPPSGKLVFVDQCGGCHALAAAGATGQFGPDLDQLKPTRARVEAQVRNGGGGMPPFQGELSDAEIVAVARYVSASAGR